MTKKHFISAAKIISAESDRATAQKMANLIILMNDNANFDRERFLSACGLWQIRAGIKQKAFK